MAATQTAQAALISEFIRVSAPSRPPFKISESSPGVLSIIGSTDIEEFALVANGTYFAANVPAVVANVSNVRRDVLIPHTTVPGDRIQLRFKQRTSTSYEYQAVLSTTLDVINGGFNHNTQASTTIVPGASDRRLVVVESAAGHADEGKLWALTPGQASGIPIPGMRVLPALPVTGSIQGETVYETTTKTASVWTGSRWSPITPSPINTFPTDALLKNDITLAVGSYGIATDTGNMYTRSTTGWRRVGIIIVPTTTALPADALPGEECLAADVGILYVRLQGTPAGPGNVPPAGADYWRPVTIFEETEANIRAATFALNGQSAIATDTGRTFEYIGGAWVEEPINHFPTEALLLAATPPNGTLAWADDTGVVFTRTAGVWKRLAGALSTVATTVPSSPANGDTFLNNHDPVTRAKGLQIYDGTKWMSASGGGVSSLVNKYIQGTAGPIEVDLGSKDWHQINLDVMVEFRLGDEFFTLSTKTSTKAWTQWGGALKNVRAHAQKGIESKAHNIQSVVQNADWMVLSWANNDPSFAVHDPYAHVRVKMTRMYDGFLMMQTEMDYGGAGSTQIESSAFWEFDDSAPTKDIQYLVFNGYGSNVRLGMTGRLTVVE